MPGLSLDYVTRGSKVDKLCVEAWFGWVDGDDTCEIPDRHCLVPRRESVPAGMRRRLSPAGLATCNILADLMGDADLPVIYVSRHGRAGNTLRLLQELAQEGGISPSRFSLSVHNAVAGIYSIASQHVNTIQAISAAGDELQALVLEATAYLHGDTAAVVVVFAEEAFPEAYEGYVRGPSTACVAGMRLSLNPALQLYSGMPTLPHQHGANPLDLLQWLAGHSDSASRGS